jgi:cytochrome c-type biogenesis protein CcsB
MNISALETNTLITVISLYGLGFLFYLLYLISPKILKEGKIASLIILVGLIVHIGLIILRMVVTRHPPFQTLYEALSWFGFTVVLTYLIVEWRSRIRLPGILVLAITLSALIYALIGFSPEPKPLPPALQSKWFVWHVIFAFGSYATFVVGFAVEILYLVIGKRGKRYGLDEKAKKHFHRMSYNLILFGFPLLSFGIISGAAWAQDAWGGYWFWDPKETWSLITWTIFAIYLHSMVTPGWRKRKSSYLIILGFVCMIFTFLGVNWLTRLFNIPSLHAY